MLPSLVSRVAVSLSNYHCKVLEVLVNKLLAALLLYGMKDPFQFG
jgi:hypothetical protein